MGLNRTLIPSSNLQLGRGGGTGIVFVLVTQEGGIVIVNLEERVCTNNVPDE